MADNPIPVPQGATFTPQQQQIPPAQVAPALSQSAPAAPPQGAMPVPEGASFVAQGQNETGEAKGDTGSTIITPKNLGGSDEESFTDTVKRATDRAKNNPDQIKKEIEDETTARNLGTKTAETLGGAAAIGFGGEAALATPGELLGMAKAATGELLPALTKGVKAVGEWAEAHPTMAKLVLEGIKDSAVLGAGYKILKTTTK